MLIQSFPVVLKLLHETVMVFPAYALAGLAANDVLTVTFTATALLVATLVPLRNKRKL